LEPSVRFRALFSLACTLCLGLGVASRPATADPGPAAALEPVHGAGQVVAIDQPFVVPLAVRAVDADGTPVPGVTVYFEAPHCRNDGTVCATPGSYPTFPANAVDATATSGADGVATAPAIMAGNQAIGLLEFTATIYADAPGSAVVARSTFWIDQRDAAPSVPITAAFTGAWYDPNQSGHGLFVEVLPQNRLLAYWFTFTPDGQQAWFGGVGDIVANEAIVHADQGQGGRWIPNFDPAQYSSRPWGTLTLTFTDCDHGRVDFFGADDASDWGNGYMDLSRLTTPAGLSCP